MPVNWRRRHARAIAGVAALMLWPGLAANSLAATGEHAQEGATNASAFAAAFPDRVTVFEHNDLYKFNYSYPMKLKQVPALKAYLEGEAAVAQNWVAHMAADQQALAKAHGSPFKPFEYVTVWFAIGNVPGWISLVRETHSEVGGEHDRVSYQAMLWGKKANKEFRLEALFLSADKMEKVLIPAICDALDVQREGGRSGTHLRDPDGRSRDCVALKNTAITFWNSGGHKFNTVTVMIMSDAGEPYAEASYAILPITPPIVKAIRPEFRKAFSVAP